MDAVSASIFAAWPGVLAKLLADPAEAGRRFRRRFSTFLSQPPRPWCLVVRANDRRMDHRTTLFSDDYAISKTADPSHLGRVVEHQVCLDAPLLRLLCGPVDLSFGRVDDRHAAAKLLGVTDARIDDLVQRKKLTRERAWQFGFGGPRGRSVRMPKNATADPNAPDLQPIDPDCWGNVWRWAPSLLDDDFAQWVTRVPHYRPGGLRAFNCYHGWHWLCPMCGKRCRLMMCPTRPPGVAKFTGDEAALRRAIEHLPDGADVLALLDRPAATPCFACYRCHRVRQFSRGMHPRLWWNLLIAHVSEGMLFGREVERPESLNCRWKRAFMKPKSMPSPRTDEVARLLADGLTYAAVAKRLGIRMGTLQRHVRTVYARYDVHRKRDLAEAMRREREANREAPSLGLAG
jgi:DNA-binding CsgD family transcriptional regulator